MRDRTRQAIADGAGFCTMIFLSLYVLQLLPEEQRDWKTYGVVFGLGLLLRLFGYVEGASAEAARSERTR